MQKNKIDPKTAQQEALMSQWKLSVSKQVNELKDTHTSKELVFSTTELRQLVKLYTIETIAKQAIDDKLNNDVLTRVGVVPSPEIRILYDLSVGRFMVFTPKEVKK